MEKYTSFYTFFVVATTAMLFLSACYTEEKKPGANLRVVDTVDLKTASERKTVFPGGDAFQQGCELVQDQAEALLEEYYGQGTTNGRRKQIITELKNLDKQWKEMDCSQVFGYMIPEIPNLPQADKAKDSMTESRVVK